MKFIPKEFPKLPSYRKQADVIHSVSNVICLEKIDGTNTRIGISKEAQQKEDIVIGGRMLLQDDPNFSQDFLISMIHDNEELCKSMLYMANNLNQDITLYGETCGGKIQAGYIYGSRPHFLLFAAQVGERWVSYKRSVVPPITSDCQKTLPTLLQIAEQLKLPVVPCLYEGIPDVEKFSNILEIPSQHSINQGFQRKSADTTQEGIVIWSDPILFDTYGIPIVAKYKTAKRREHHDIDSKDAQSETPQKFAERVVLEERIKHAISHVQETGRWQNNPQEDLDSVVRRVIQDVSREVVEYQDQLSKFGKKSVRQALEKRAQEVFVAMQ